MLEHSENAHMNPAPPNTRFDLPSTALARRSVLIGSGGLIITALIGGCEKQVTPEQAAKLSAQIKSFSKHESATFTKFSDIIVPGSTAAGTVHFVDYQLRQDPNDCLLMLKYFQITPPYVGFYKAGLKALDGFSRANFGKSFVTLTSTQHTQIVKKIIAGPTNWSGPPAFLFYMFVRSDAVDLVYGTPEGFEKLSVPYMAHIDPPKGWAS